MDRQIFQIPGEISKFETMAQGAIRLRVDSQEAIEPEYQARLFALCNKVGWFTFNATKIEAQDLLDLPDFDPSKYDSAKSPSQRLRAVLFLVHKSKGGKKEDFDAYYINVMNKLIEQYKGKIDD